MNGRIQSQIVSGGGENEYGETIAAQTTWGEKVNCKYQANTMNNRGRYTDGEFTQSAFTITITDMNFTANVIRLFDSRDNEVCIKEVQSLEVLESIQRVKITV